MIRYFAARDTLDPCAQCLDINLGLAGRLDGKFALIQNWPAETFSSAPGPLLCDGWSDSDDHGVCRLDFLCQLLKSSGATGSARIVARSTEQPIPVAKGEWVDESISSGLLAVI